MILDWSERPCLLIGTSHAAKANPEKSSSIRLLLGNLTDMPGCHIAIPHFAGSRCIVTASSQQGRVSNVRND